MGDDGPGALEPSRTPVSCATLSPVSLLTELDAFFAEHMRCGGLDAGVEGPVFWFACGCGAHMVRRVDEHDDARRA
jgi:hypothetical protein